MTDTVAAPAVAAPRVKPLRWWHEVLFILGFYGIYTTIRNTQGSASVSATHAFHNARHIIHWERLLGIYHERWVQQRFIAYHGFIRFWDVFYGSAHFIVSIAALVYLFRKMPARYPRLRNTLAITTALALLGFATYPLMPPRLLPHAYGFVDTLKAYGGLWSFDSGTMQKISNQYAAMPSLHFAWSSWCVLVLWPAMRRPWSRAVLLTYPLITLFAIVVTANHYVLDAAGGALALAIGYTASVAITRQRTTPDPAPAPAA
ncbi:MAG: phosphatase PAP2 family protein [Actinobacteria bacterium]|nr:MAG: phosphatase PAP2 family protein [Actinomycetota bacterium]